MSVVLEGNYFFRLSGLKPNETYRWKAEFSEDGTGPAPEIYNGGYAWKANAQGALTFNIAIDEIARTGKAGTARVVAFLDSDPNQTPAVTSFGETCEVSIHIP